MFYAYIIRSREGLLYSGSTPDLETCLERHNAGQVARTRAGSGWDTVYTEPFTTREEAVERERWFRTDSGRQFVKRLLEQRSAQGS